MTSKTKGAGWVLDDVEDSCPLDPSKMAQYLLDSAEGNFHDALGGLLLAGGKADTCGGEGLLDAKNLHLVTKKNPTSFGLEVLGALDEIKKP